MSSAGFYLMYLTSRRTIPACWTIGATMIQASGSMESVFEQEEDSITSMWVERWQDGILKETIHLYPDCAAEAVCA